MVGWLTQESSQDAQVKAAAAQVRMLEWNQRKKKLIPSRWEFQGKLSTYLASLINGQGRGTCVSSHSLF
jgi:hypothetical protein